MTSLLGEFYPCFLGTFRPVGSRSRSKQSGGKKPKKQLTLKVFQLWMRFEAEVLISCRMYPIQIWIRPESEFLVRTKTANITIYLILQWEFIKLFPLLLMCLTTKCDDSQPFKLIYSWSIFRFESELKSQLT